MRFSLWVFCKALFHEMTNFFFNFELSLGRTQTLEN